MRILPLLSLCLLFMSACSGSIVPPPRSAEILMNEGDTFLQEHRYEDAIASWEKVRERFATPEMTALAERKIADANFQTERYVEAAVAYEAYLKAHPDDPQNQDVLYKLGVSYHKEMLDAERDQTATRNAISVFKTFLTRYPTDPKRTEIEKYIADEEESLAGHELHVGRFYQKKGADTASISRLEPVVTTYPKFSKMDEVYFILGSAYLQNSNREKAVEYFNRLYNNFPQSHFKVKAQRLLEKQF